ncbi:MAG: hypothetical protein Q4C72_04855 [Eubacteriales bacterium]|nr:hypothetical protein [Eubacteriales bacterium]
MNLKKRVVCLILICAAVTVSAFALTARVSGKWITTSTDAAYQTAVTADTKAYLYAKSWIEDDYGSTVADGSEYQATNASSCYAHAVKSLSALPSKCVGRGVGFVWLTPDTAWDMGNPAFRDHCYTNKSFSRSSNMNSAQRYAYDQLQDTIDARTEDIINTFDLDLTDFESIPITDLESLDSYENDIQDIVMQVVAQHDIKAGDSKTFGFLNNSRTLLYAMKQDASLMNHLDTYEPDEDGRWLKTSEISIASSGINNADVQEAVEQFEQVVYGD